MRGEREDRNSVRLCYDQINMNEWKSRLGIPLEARDGNASEELPNGELFAESARRKIENLVDSPGIHTTLARADNPNDLRTVLEHGLFATRNDDPSKDLIFYNNHKKEDGQGFANDSILAFCILTRGFSITLVIDDERVLRDGANMNEVPALGTGRPNFVGGHTISGVKNIPNTSIKGIVIGIGEKAYDEVYKVAIERTKETETRHKKELDGDERITILHDVMTEYVERYKTDPDQQKKLLSLKDTVLRMMMETFRGAPDLAMPIYDLNGKVLWPI